jgi:hypothetical protein
MASAVLIFPSYQYRPIKGKISAGTERIHIFGDVGSSQQMSGQCMYYWGLFNNASRKYSLWTKPEVVYCYFNIQKLTDSAMQLITRMYVWTAVSIGCPLQFLLHAA